MGKVRYVKNTEASIKGRTPNKDTIYFSTDTNKIFMSHDGATFVEYSVTPTAPIVQTTGTDMNKVMSQGAVSLELMTKSAWKIGTSVPDEVPSGAGQFYIVSGLPGKLFVSAVDVIHGGFCWYEVSSMYPSTTAPVMETTEYPGGSMTSPWTLNGEDDYSDTNSLEEVLNEYMNE